MKSKMSTSERFESWWQMQQPGMRIDPDTLVGVFRDLINHVEKLEKRVEELEIDKILLEEPIDE